MLEGILNGIAGIMSWFNDKLPNFNVDSNKLTEAIAFIKPKWEIADKIFPMTETLFVLGVLCTYAVAMVVFWGIQRLLNLLRGAG